MPRWYVYFNFSALRMISYSMDVYWANNDSGTTVMVHGGP
jgi:hypothetical protein